MSYLSPRGGAKSPAFGWTAAETQPRSPRTKRAGAPWRPATGSMRQPRTQEDERLRRVRRSSRRRRQRISPVPRSLQHHPWPRNTAAAVLVRRARLQDRMDHAPDDSPWLPPRYWPPSPSPHPFCHAAQHRVSSHVPRARAREYRELDGRLWMPPRGRDPRGGIRRAMSADT